MRVSKKAKVISMPSLPLGLGAQAWSVSFSQAALIDAQVVPANPGGISLLGEGVRKMKVLGNTAALFVALLLMGGLILAQRGYQNRWHEPNAVQMSATDTNAGTPEQAGVYNVVMK
ncbi:MAG: hypothetical protein JOZ29_19275 [Deltaproteobacteria bacterium]|nr:hypothetical protein [Deltaproteobacteria bacterium]